MADVAVPFDVDPTADMYLDYDERTVGAFTVRVPKLIIVDGTSNIKAGVTAAGALKVEVQAPANGVDAHSRGATGTTPSAVNVNNTSTVLLTAGTTRRAVWLTNTGAAGTSIVWVWIGGGTAIAGRGVPLNPGATIVIDNSPNAALSAISESATQSIAIGIEAD